MPSWYRSMALCGTLLAAALGSPATASADGGQEKAAATPAEAVPAEPSAAGRDEKAGEAGVTAEEAESRTPGRPEEWQAELSLEELWMLTNPWEDEGIEVHGARSRRGESRIPTHGGRSSERDITIHSQTSGDAERIPLTRIGECNDAGIIVHGGSERGPSRIRVHGPARD